MRAWETSGERRRWLEESRLLLQEDENVRVLTGLETWFTMPSKPAEAPRPVLNKLPTLLRSLVLTVIMVSLMTYIVMPRMTRLFSFWLYPDRE